MATKTYETKEAGTLEIRSIVPARVAEAGKQLKREGISSDLTSSDLENSPLVAAEMARICIVRWQLPDGSEPLAGLKPPQARARIAEEEGLIDFVMGKAREIEKEGGARFEVISGN